MPYRTYIDHALLTHPLLRPRTISWSAALVVIPLAVIAGAALAALSFVVSIPGLS